VMVDSFAKWRIGDVGLFYTTVGGDEFQANLRLDQIVKDAMRSEFGVRTIKQLVSEDRSELRDTLLAKLAPLAGQYGIELIDIPQTKMSGKNSADIRMVVDALDLCYSKNHIDTFALLSGDSDFSPLVSKLKENNKRVIGCGVKNSTSDMLIANCDEFIYYDDLVRMVQTARAAARPQKPKETHKDNKDSQKDKDETAEKKQEAIEWLCEIVRSQQADYETLWGSQVKQTIRRVHPGFNEAYYGYKSFTDLIKDAENRGLLRLEYDEARGNYKVKLKEE